ncbi:hypothetical protein HJC23_007324 [Cyclotella cryptica]|uniref:Dynein attachment factor N-terminal domain-containing protein n=1 Tax=Cyclotella cryptica TaxID=29204 RepID=A0ABD3P0Q0_9STRA|eukprot:CCRYP_019302-RA/>CCRYP_019302-RA protein AED:0.00 eAED:-0.00 QI:0/-1/0/1/-1/1/1/0/323
MAKSIITSDGKSVDVSRLEREINEDLALYRRHTAEDGMKKKAIHTSKDYDEFRNFVSAAQLKPTSGRDVSNLLTGAAGSLPQGSRNFSFRNKCDGPGIIGGYDGSIQRRIDEVHYQDGQQGASRKFGKKSRDNNSLVLKNNNHLPSKSSREAYDFLREWKQHCTNSERTLDFLTRIKPRNNIFSEPDPKREFVLPAEETCKRHFSTDVDCEILCDIIDALYLLSQMTNLPGNDIISDHHEEGSSPGRHPSLDNIESTGMYAMKFIDEWLRSLAQCGRFGLSVSFLSSAQITKLKDILNVVKRSTAEVGENAAGYVEQYEKVLR